MVVLPPQEEYPMVNVGERLGLLPDSQFEVSELPEGLQLTRTSIFTRKRNTMTLPIDASTFIRWRRGEMLVQDAFPHLSADQREFLMSGATPEEWSGIFASDDEEEDPC
jgi:hypothetical protein